MNEEQLNSAFLALCGEWQVSLGGLYEDAAKELARRAMAAECERCAKMCEDSNTFAYDDPGEFFARLIRKTPNVLVSGDACTRAASGFEP